MKYVNLKILGFVSFLISANASANASEKKIVNKNQLTKVSLINNRLSIKISSEKVSLESIKSVFNGFTKLNEKERYAIAKEMRSDFTSFMNKYFILDENQNKCLETNWKSDKNLINVIEVLATTVEKQGAIGEDVYLDEDGINNAPAAKKHHEIDIHGEETNGGVYTIHGGIKISW